MTVEKVSEDVGRWVGGSLLYRLGCSVRLPLGLCWCATKLQTGWNAAVLSQQRWQFWERGGRMFPPLLYTQSTQCFCHRRLPLSLKLYNFAKAWELQPRNQHGLFFFHGIAPCCVVFLVSCSSWIHLFQAAGLSTSSLGKLLWGPMSCVVSSC